MNGIKEYIVEDAALVYHARSEPNAREVGCYELRQTLRGCWQNAAAF